MSTSTLRRRWSESESESLLTESLYQPTASRLSRREVPQTDWEPPFSDRTEYEVRFGSRGFFLFPRRPPEWLLPVLYDVGELGHLPANWNSYGSPPIQPEAAEATLDILVSLLDPSDSLPSVVPTNSGGIMLEWHERGLDLEIDIRSLFEIHVAIEGQGIDEEILDADHAAIRKALGMLRKEPD